MRRLPRRRCTHISVVMLVGAVLSAAPWRAAMRFLLLNALSFPIIMALAAAFSPAMRAQWSDTPTVLAFVSNYIFVLASGVVGAVASHTVWAAHQQLYQARKLGRYRLEARVGAGGMGEVWLAWDDVLRRNIALKILRARRALGSARRAAARGARRHRAPLPGQGAQGPVPDRAGARRRARGAPRRGALDIGPRASLLAHGARANSLARRRHHRPVSVCQYGARVRQASRGPGASRH